MQFLPWIDLIWIPLTLLFVERKQWLPVIGLILVCALCLRLQVEFMQAIGYPNGFFTFLDYPLLSRGQIVYSLFIAGLMALLHFSKGEGLYIVIAALISIFMMGFCVSTGVMIL